MILHAKDHNVQPAKRPAKIIQDLIDERIPRQPLKREFYESLIFQGIWKIKSASGSMLLCLHAKVRTKSQFQGVERREVCVVMTRIHFTVRGHCHDSRPQCKYQSPAAQVTAEPRELLCNGQC